MRSITAAGVLGLLLLTAGCERLKPFIQPKPPVTPVSREKVTKESLLAHLNDNAQRLQSLECRQVVIAASMGNQPIDLIGPMSAQKPRNFRFNAKILGANGVDLGSNDQEFWYWISKADPPYLIHCSYEDLKKGLSIPFPIQPEWIMETLGMAEYDAAANWQLRESGTQYELIQQTTSPQGQTVYKAIVFQRGPSGRIQVIGHVLMDPKGTEICRAVIRDWRVDQGSGAAYPERVVLTCPSEKVKMDLRLDGVVVNGRIDRERAADLFSRPKLSNVPSYDLGRRQLNQPTGNVQRAGGFFR
jgi:hypothetical protein